MSTPNKPITNITQGVTGDLPLAPGKSIEGFSMTLRETGTAVLEIPRGTQLVRVYSEHCHAVLKWQSASFHVQATVQNYDEFIPKGWLLDIGYANDVNGEYPSRVSINGVPDPTSSNVNLGTLWIMFK